MTSTAAVPRTSTPAEGARTPPSIPRALDALLALDAGALSALYAGASVPNLADVRGDLRGRMLATTVLGGRAASAVRAFASSSAFPWRGKTFTPKDAPRGDGINRVVRDRWHLYRFETFIGPSRAGDFDALQLDYDLPENPAAQRGADVEAREPGAGMDVRAESVGSLAR